MSRRTWIPALLLAAVAACPPASQAAEPAPAWDLPPHGAAIYDRVWDAEGLQAIRGLAAPLNAAVLFRRELDADGARVAAPLYDLRDLPLWIAADLQRAGEGGVLTFECDQISGFDAHRVTAMYGARTPEGSQPVLVRIEPVDREAPATTGLVRIDGRLRVDRRVDLKAGRLQGFESSFTFERKTGQEDEPYLRSTIEESWTLREVLEPTDRRFRRRVEEAIRDSATFLHDHLDRASFAPGALMGPAQGPRAHQSQGAGYLALALLAVIKSERFDDDPAIERALTELRSREIETTYSLACAIMALEALHAPRGERDRLMRDPGAQPEVRKLNARDQAVVERWTAALLAAQDTRTDAGYTLRWRYASGPSYDNSNTQYALLGLYSAHLCGVEIRPFVWEATATHWLDDMLEVEGDKVRLRLTRHDEVKARREEAARLERGGYGAATRTQDRGKRVRPVAWGYIGPRYLSGSMTAAGVASLTIADSAARGGRGFRGGLGPHTERAIRGGMAWLAEHFTVRANPGTRHSLGSRFYYLYSLERALELNRVAWLNGRDWYFEGAVWLLETQYEDGGWPGSIADTSFGLLFLKKAVPPVVTITR